MVIAAALSARAHREVQAFGRAPRTRSCIPTCVRASIPSLQCVRSSGVARVDLLRHILLLLRRHGCRIRLPGNTARSELLTLNVVFGETGFDAIRLNSIGAVATCGGIFGAHVTSLVIKLFLKMSGVTAVNPPSRLVVTDGQPFVGRFVAKKSSGGKRLLEFAAALNIGSRCSRIGSAGGAASAEHFGSRSAGERADFFHTASCVKFLTAQSIAPSNGIIVLRTVRSKALCQTLRGTGDCGGR